MVELQYQSSRKTTFAKTRKGVNKPLNWPHPLVPKSISIHPTLLSRAGFYHTPTLALPDAATCYLCNTVVSDWNEGDDAMKRHGEGNENCSYIKMVNVGWEEWIEERDWQWGSDGNDWPRSDAMTRAREDTFRIGWSHNNVEGIPTPRQIAEAGMYFKPSSEVDEADNCACPYCLRSVASWEAGDDPIALHRRKAGLNCPFFLAPDPRSVLPKQPKASTSSSASSKKGTKQKTVVAMEEEEEAIVDQVVLVEQLAPVIPKKSKARGKKAAPASSLPAELAPDLEEGAAEAEALVVVTPPQSFVVSELKSSATELRVTKSAPALLPRSNLVSSAVVSPLDSTDAPVFANASGSRGVQVVEIEEEEVVVVETKRKKGKGKAKATKSKKVVDVPDEPRGDAIEVDRTVEHIDVVEEEKIVLEKVIIEAAVPTEVIELVEKEMQAEPLKLKKKKAITKGKSKKKTTPLVIHMDDNDDDVRPSTPQTTIQPRIIHKSPSKPTLFSVYSPSLHPFLAAPLAPPTETELTMSLESWYDLCGRRVHEQMKLIFDEEDRIFVDKVDEAKRIVQDMIASAKQRDERLMGQ